YAPGDSSRAFIVEQRGTIRILRLPENVLEPAPFLTIPDVSFDNERGLLGLAFHPNFASNGYFYVYCTVDTAEGPVWRYSVSSDSPDLADANSRQIVIRSGSGPSHIAGWIALGPDGYLYIARGDGAGRGSPQSLTGFGGKILRIDVDRDDFPADPQRNYAIPP